MIKRSDKKQTNAVKPLVPSFAANPEGYKTTYQNNAINQLTRVNTKKDKPDKDAPAFQRKYSNENISILMKKAVTELTPQVNQHLVYIMTRFFEQSNKEDSLEVDFTLKEYKADFGKKDSKTARKTLEKVFDDLTDLRFEYHGGNDKKKKDKPFTYLVPIPYAHYERGKAKVQFVPAFRDMLLNGTMLMYIHPLYFKLNPNQEAVAQSILYEMAVNKRTNASKKSRQDHISIKSLLPKIHSLSSYDEVMKTDKHVTHRIIDPFFKALERLAKPEDGAFSDYYLLDKNNKPLDYDNLTYEDFINSYLFITWKDYPEDVLKTVGDKKKAADNKSKKKEAKQQ